MIMQGMVDNRGLFTDVYVGWPGRVHYARVFANSTIGPLHTLNQFAERQFESRKKKKFSLNFLFLPVLDLGAFQLAPRQGLVLS